jgi:hypothetical protein
VIGVSARREGEDHHLRLQLPEDGHHPLPGFVGVVQVGIGESGVVSAGEAEHLGGPGGLLAAEGGAASAAGFPGGEVEHRGAVPLVMGPEEGAAAGEFGVVPVGGDGEQVDGHSCLRASTGSIWEARLAG